MNTTTTTMRAMQAGVLAAGALAAGLSGCRGDRSDKPPHMFLPDMDDAPKQKPQVKTEFFADGRSMRPELANTVPFSRVSMTRDAWEVADKPEGAWASKWAVERENFLRENWEVFEGAKPVRNPDGTVAFKDGVPDFTSIAGTIPIPVTPELLKRGQERFNIYCSVCHGYEGDGKGMVGDPKKPSGGWSGVANFHDIKYRDPAQRTGKDGYIFWTARNGVLNAADKGEQTQRMPGYAHALDARDTWAIVAYIRVLQEAWSGTLNDVPEAQRAAVEKSRQTMYAQAQAAEAAKAAADAAEKAKAQQQPEQPAAKPNQAPAGQQPGQGNQPAKPAGGQS